MSDGCWDWLTWQQIWRTVELSIRGPMSASIGLRLPGVLPGKSFHSYLAETSRIIKGWWDLLEKADLLLTTVRDCWSYIEYCIWEVCSSGLQTYNRPSRSTSSVKALLLRWDCWLISAWWDAYWIIIPSFPETRGWHWLSWLAKVCFLRWVDVD